MLNRRIRNATAAARPVNASGVAEMRVFVRAPSARNAASNRRRNVGSGAWPVDEQHNRDREERDDERAGRDDDREPAAAGRAAARSAARAASRTPAIRSPIWSTVATRASTSPTSAPSYITTMRSARVRSSSRSSLIEQHADVLGGRVAQVPVDGLDRADVEPAGRGRDDEHLRIARELPCENDLLQVPAREVPRRQGRARAPGRHSDGSARRPGRGSASGAGTAHATARRPGRT